MVIIIIIFFLMAVEMMMKILTPLEKEDSSWTIHTNACAQRFIILVSVTCVVFRVTTGLSFYFLRPAAVAAAVADDLR